MPFRYILLRQTVRWKWLAVRRVRGALRTARALHVLVPQPSSRVLAECVATKAAKMSRGSVREAGQVVEWIAFEKRVNTLMKEAATKRAQSTAKRQLFRKKKGEIPL